MSSVRDLPLWIKQVSTMIAGYPDWCKDFVPAWNAIFFSVRGTCDMGYNYLHATEREKELPTTLDVNRTTILAEPLKPQQQTRRVVSCIQDSRPACLITQPPYQAHNLHLQVSV